MTRHKQPRAAFEPDARAAIAQRIRQRREALEMSQTDLAERCGCSPMTIWMVEQGKHVPSLPLLVRLAIHLTRTTDHILGLIDDEEEPRIWVI